MKTDNSIKIFKYELKDISCGIHLNDVEFFIFQRMESTFTRTILELRVHTFGDNGFYFISDMEDQNKMIDLFSTVENLKEFGDFETSYKDVTDQILNNIDNFDSVENFNDKNTILDFYYDINNQDTVLDKILEKGVDSLSKHDKIILDQSVK
jgi:hypothetical protein